MILTRRVFNGAVLAACWSPPGRSRPHWPIPRFHFRRRRSRRLRPRAARFWSKSMPTGARPARRRDPILDKLTADPKFKESEDLPRRFRCDEAGGQTVRRPDAVDADRLQGVGRTGTLRRRHQGGLDRSPARQEPLEFPGDRARAGLRGRAAVDPVALRAAAGPDRARHGGCRASARRGCVGRRSLRCRSRCLACCSRWSASGSASMPACSGLPPPRS